MSREEVADRLLRPARVVRAAHRRLRQHAVAPGSRTRSPRDRREDGREFENGEGVAPSVGTVRNRRRGRRGARIQFGNGFFRGCGPLEAGPGGKRETGLGRLPAWLFSSARLYSAAFMRAIIFRFAAFSFRFFRSLGFSKC